MKKWLLLLAAFLTLAGVLTACKRGNPQTTMAQPPPQAAPATPPPPPPVIVRIHFAGVDNISADTNSLAFTNEFASTEARALESQTLDKLSRAPGDWFKSKLPMGAGDGSAQLRPLLDDFLKSEWIFEMRGATDSPEYALAIRLDDTRAQLWQTNLENLLESWTKITAQNITNGWELKKDLPPNLFRFVRAGNWVLIGCGQNELPLSDEWSQTGTGLEKETNWLSARVDWPRVGQLFPALAKFDFPVTTIQVIGTNRNFFMTGKFELSQPLPTLDKWQIPTNLIRQPLTSLTTARGFVPWLENQSWAKGFELSPEPDEFFSWAMRIPLQAFIAFPVSNATNALAQMARNFTVNTNWQEHLVMPFQMTATNAIITWQGMPFIKPEIRALHDSSGDFLLADVFPVLPMGKAAPAELLQAASRDNLVFYHWELTSFRLKTLPQLTQLGLMLTSHRQLEANSVAGRWLNRIAPTPGDSVTEVMQAGPLELTFTRSAPDGLTAAELIALANWLEAPRFPAFDLKLPPRLKPLLHRPIKVLSAPTPVHVSAPTPVRTPAPPPTAPH